MNLYRREDNARPCDKLDLFVIRGKASTMNRSPIAVSATSRRKEDLAYQAVTVVAMVTLLVSVWIF